MPQSLENKIAKEQLVHSLTLLRLNVLPGEFGLVKDLRLAPYCQNVSAELLNQFKQAVINVNNDVVELTKKTKKKPKPKLLRRDILLLTEVIKATNELFNNPTDKHCLEHFSKTTDALQQSPFNYQALAGNLLMVVAVVSIIILFPAITLTWGFIPGWGAAMLGTLVGFIGGAIERESKQNLPSPPAFKNTELATHCNQLKATAIKVKDASRRYGFFNAISNVFAAVTQPQSAANQRVTPLLR